MDQITMTARTHPLGGPDFANTFIARSTGLATFTVAFVLFLEKK